MNSSVVIAPQANQGEPVSSVPDSSEAIAPPPSALIAKQPLFNGFNFKQLHLVAIAALEIKFEAGHDDILLWVTTARTARTRPRVGLPIHKGNAKVATESLRATQRRLMQYIDKNIPEQP